MTIANATLSNINTGTNGNATDTPSVEVSHSVLVGVLIMIVMLVILTEVAGTSHQWAVIVGLLLAAPLMFEGFTHIGNFSNWARNNPYNPTQTVTV